MDAGLIVEQGSHADLLCRRGCCYSLCNSQSSEALAQAAKLAALSARLLFIAMSGAFGHDESGARIPAFIGEIEPGAGPEKTA